MLDSSHPAVIELKRLLPSCTVYGGSFSHLMPNIKSVSLSNRPVILKSMQSEWTSRALSEVMRQLNFDPQEKIGRGNLGYRKWPKGYVGSITHKGTVVLVAMAKKRSLSSVGIDLERTQNTHFSLFRNMIAPEGHPPISDEAIALQTAFSVKEASFKLAYPINPVSVRFRDIRVAWNEAGDGILLGSVSIKGFPAFVAKCCLSIPWIVSVATLPSSTGS